MSCSTSTNRLKISQSHQKSYFDIKKRNLEFNLDDWIYLNVSPMKGMVWFDKKGKLSPRYLRPYQILKRASKMAYVLEFPIGNKYSSSGVLYINVAEVCG